MAKTKTRLETLPKDYCGDDFDVARQEVIQAYPVLVENKELSQKYPDLIDVTMVLHQTYEIRKLRDQVDEDFQILPSYEIATVNDLIYLLIQGNEKAIEAYEYIKNLDKTSNPYRIKSQLGQVKRESRGFHRVNIDKLLEKIKKSA